MARYPWYPMRALITATTALALVVGVLPAAAAQARDAVVTPRFVAETRKDGIDHVYDGEFAYYVGGGVAAFDCDGDGFSDLYFAGGSNPAALYRNVSKAGGPLRFQEVADPASRLDAVTGAYPLDVDGDGSVDLALLRNGENVILRGLGDCRFERANERWAFDGGNTLTTAFSAKWEGTAALPTLAFGNYFDLEASIDAWACSDNLLVRPIASAPRYAAPIALLPSWCPLSMLFSDWDRSGRVDLRMSNDRAYYPADEGMEQLWRVAPGEPPRQYTAEDGWQTLRLWGMGIASHDVTGDGYPDVYLTSIGPNRLQTLADGPTQPNFTDISIPSGVVATNPVGDMSLPSTAWHDEFADVNNDGLIDLYVSKGNVNEMPESAMADPDVLFLGQPDGTFVDRARAAGIRSPERGRGAAVVDLNLDGLLDIVQLNRRDQVLVWRNVGGGTAKRTRSLGDWLALRLEQDAPNRDAVGAWVEVRAGDDVLTSEVTVGGGHAGGQLGWIHVGLGPVGRKDRVEVRIGWPGEMMEWGPWLEVDANRFLRVRRGSERAEVWRPRKP